MRHASLRLLLTLAVSTAAVAQHGGGGSVGITGDAATTDSARLQRLFDADWTRNMNEYPEWGTWVGWHGGHGRWTDNSQAAMQSRREVARNTLKALDAIDRTALNDVDRLSYDLFRRDLEQGIADERFHGEYMALNQLGGIHQSAPSLLLAMSTSSGVTYDDILSRLRGLPAVIDQDMELMKEGLRRGITPPRIVLRDVPAQIEALLADDPLDSPLLMSFRKFPSTVDSGRHEKLRAEAVEIYRTMLQPAVKRLHDFVADVYIPGARETIGMSAMPDGHEWYASAVRRQTTTNLSPGEIHEIGLKEVARIRGEMEKVIATTGFKGSFQEFLDFLRTDPQFFHKDAESLLAGYRDICKRADPELIRLFGRLPRLPYGVIPIPSYSEKSQTTAYYNPGSLEAGRPGYFYANTYNLKARPKWEMEALALHEAVPGHHLQIAIAQELEGLPMFRQEGGYTAFVEGWGLYSESLGTEMGFYKDPYSKFGQLTYEMWRAVRLVVDVGIHELGWSRDQAIRYFKENTGKTDHDIEVEVDRYITWPGQALAYKIGELKIRELRAYAERELGDAFDIRGFHDTVLGSGALPLDALEANVRNWVAQKQSAGS